MQVKFNLLDEEVDQLYMFMRSAWSNWLTQWGIISGNTISQSIIIWLQNGSATKLDIAIIIILQTSGLLL